MTDLLKRNSANIYKMLKISGVKSATSFNLPIGDYESFAECQTWWEEMRYPDHILQEFITNHIFRAAPRSSCYILYSCLISTDGKTHKFAFQCPAGSHYDDEQEKCVLQPGNNKPSGSSQSEFTVIDWKQRPRY